MCRNISNSLYISACIFSNFSYRVITDHNVLAPYKTPFFLLAYFNDTLWVLGGGEPMVHVSIDISLITKHILDHVISLES